jgi:hypothetical protein
VVLSQVDELVDDDVLDDARGQADGAQVEVQVTGGAARALPVAEVHHPHGAGCDADAFGEECYPRWRADTNSFADAISDLPSIEESIDNSSLEHKLYTLKCPGDTLVWVVLGRLQGITDQFA